MVLLQYSWYNTNFGKRHYIEKDILNWWIKILCLVTRDKIILIFIIYYEVNSSILSNKANRLNYWMILMKINLTSDLKEQKIINNVCYFLSLSQDTTFPHAIISIQDEKTMQTEQFLLNCNWNENFKLVHYCCSSKRNHKCK